MAEIVPFQGYRYNSKKIKNLKKVFVPPYDIISPMAREEFRSIHPYNMIYLTLANPRSKANPYGHVRTRLQDWIKKQVLVADAAKSLYFYTMEFQAVPDQSITLDTRKKKTVLSGFIGLVKLEEFKSGVVIPHEVTFPKPVEDRRKLLESCHSHLEPVYSLFEEKKNKIISSLSKSIKGIEPIHVIKDSNMTIHRFWKISNPSLIKVIQEKLKDKSLLIADGHHRYSAALAYRETVKKTLKVRTLPSSHPANYLMMYLVNMDDSNLAIFPTHRLVRNFSKQTVRELHKKLEKYFQITPVQEGSIKLAREKLIKVLASSKENSLFGLYDGKFYILKLKKKFPVKSDVLDASVFRDWIANKALSIPKQATMHSYIGYTHSVKEAVEKVDSGDYQSSFFLHPPDVHEVKHISKQSVSLPQKSTYFYPKPLSGFVLYSFDK